MTSLGTRRPDRGSDVREVVVPVATMWTSPSAPRSIDRPALLDVPDVPRWTGSMDATARQGLVGRTLTQLLLGEQVLVLEQRDEWVRVAALAQPSAAHQDGYPGWVRLAHLAASAGHPDRRVTVTVPAARLSLDDGATMDLSFGTALATVDDPHGSTGDRVRVLAPGPTGPRSGLLRRDAVRIVEGAVTGSETGKASPDGADVLPAAAQFLGLRYLWGGTSVWGLDCSGLTHLVLRVHGVLAPRDAADQAAWVLPVGLDDVRPGDLYFFARPDRRVHHVGIVSSAVGPDGVRRMLHAPEDGGLVEETPLAGHRLETLVSAGRVPGP